MLCVDENSTKSKRKRINAHTVVGMEGEILYAGHKTMHENTNPLTINEIRWRLLLHSFRISNSSLRSCPRICEQLHTTFLTGTAILSYSKFDSISISVLTTFCSDGVHNFSIIIWFPIWTLPCSALHFVFQKWDHCNNHWKCLAGLLSTAARHY